jgi:hypothetical protein
MNDKSAAIGPEHVTRLVAERIKTGEAAGVGALSTVPRNYSHSAMVCLALSANRTKSRQSVETP